MKRTVAAAAFVFLVFVADAAYGQSWIFQPGNYTKEPDQQTPKTEAKTKPHAYATFTEAQAAEAAKLPRPTFQWDPTGVIGRGDRFDMWNHQETMEANRLRTYAQGVRDAVGGQPIWMWHAPPPRPLPQILAPTEKSSGKALPAKNP